MKTIEIKEKDKEYIIGTYARNDLYIEKGEGALCYDGEGKKYIDFSSGIGVNALGFCDKGWVDAITKQANILQHTSNLFYTEPCVRMAELLIKRSGLSKVFFCNSGAEANEGAIKAARKYSYKKYGEGRYEIITLEDSFHGRTLATITATGQDAFHKYFDPFVEGFRYAKANDLSELQSKISEKTCAILIELIQGEGGVNQMDQEYIDGVAQICKEKDILLIIDEVQTGIGRTGKLFAYEQYGLEPELVTMAKGLGGGLPIGGILFSKKCENALESGDHGTTYGGNPIACAGGIEILNRMDEEFLQEVQEKGDFLKSELEKIDGVSAVTGMGLMIGVSLKDKDAKEVAAKCIANGLLVLTAKEKIRFLPPLTITTEEIIEGLAIFKRMMTA
ncbi:MAG: acetylornithine/succinylornithine family transaminase [Anaerovoracaceae bacterium]|jgi:acetylornithine/N-succinyldiaminopimelate aminotransferase